MKYILLFILTISLVTLSGASLAAPSSHEIQGKWKIYTGKKISIFKTPESYFIEITDKNITVSNKEESAQYSYSVENKIFNLIDKEGNTTNKRIELINDDIILFYENYKYSPLLFTKGDLPIVKYNKNTFGKWKFITDDLVEVTYDITRKKIIMISSDDNQREEAKFYYKADNGNDRYRWYDIFYEAVRISEEWSILYITVPSPDQLHVRMIKKY